MASRTGRWRPSGLVVEGAWWWPGELSAARVAELEAGPAAWGWDEDQCWTLARIAEVVRRRFRVDYTLAGLDLLLHRIGWSVQVPARQAAERDEEQVTGWREETWPVMKGRRRTWAPGSASKRVRPGLIAAAAAPIAGVTGAGNSPRLCLAALIAVKPGHRPRLIYRIRTGRKPATGARKGFTETGYARLRTPRVSNSAARSWWSGTTSTPTSAAQWPS